MARQPVCNGPACDDAPGHSGRSRALPRAWKGTDKLAASDRPGTVPRAWKGRHALGERSRIGRSRDGARGVESAGMQIRATAFQSPPAIAAMITRRLHRRVMSGVRSGMSWRARVCLSKRDRTCRVGRLTPHPHCATSPADAGAVTPLSALPHRSHVRSHPRRARATRRSTPCARSPGCHRDRGGCAPAASPCEFRPDARPPSSP